VRIDPLMSIEAYSRFCLQGMADHIETKFALVVQWDGYVVNSTAWANAFRKYDYIGATQLHWPQNCAVGNGGFSLRSRRLLKAVQKLPPLGGYPEDRLICLAYRARLEQESGIRFAPVIIADRFAHQDKTVARTPFGFHGPVNLPRYTEDAELATVLEAMDIHRKDPDIILRLLLSCLDHDRPRTARILYDRFRETRSPVIMRRVLTEWHGPLVAEGELARLEALPRR
jgi:hypothetical protein